MRQTLLHSVPLVFSIAVGIVGFAFVTGCDTSGLPEADQEIVYQVVEEMPTIIGGVEMLQNYVIYPVEAIAADIEGMVIIEFVVNRQGRAEDFRVARGIGYGCDEAAIRAIGNLRFRPGRLHGKAVLVKMSLPVRFILNDSTGLRHSFSLDS